MSKVCVLQNSMSYGGTDTFVINLCKGLLDDGHDVTVILSMDKGINAPRIEELSQTGVRIQWTCSPQNGVKSKAHHLWLLYHKLKRENYDVFHTNIDLFNGLQLLVARIARIPVRVCHSHNSEHGRELALGRTLSVQLYQVIMRWLCWKFSNRRAGCSEAALDFLFKNKWRSDFHSRVIHNGIKMSNYCNYFDINNKKKKIGLNMKRNICTVGRISYQKNPFFIVEVMKELFELRDDCDFVWVGVGDMEEQVKEKINEYGIMKRMHMLGERNDVPEILRSCDLFFLPSNFEGLGIVLIEAQAANLPCIISDVVPVEADCGLCMEISLKQSAHYWAQQINSVFDGKCNLSVDIEKLNEYSIDNMVSEMEELFEI